MGVGADTWVVVKDFGRKKISTITPGEHVLAHNGRFQPVLEVVDEGMRDTIEALTREGRRLVMTLDQRLLVGKRESWTNRKLEHLSWQREDEMKRRGPFSSDYLKIVRPAGTFELPSEKSERAKLYIMLAVLNCAERMDDGSWQFHKLPHFLPEVIAETDLRFDTPYIGPSVIYDVPYVDDMPVEGSCLPRVLFTGTRRASEWMIDVLLMFHGCSWPWEAGHYLRATSYVAASHLQHILVCGGIGTGIDEGNRWVLGEGPVWRVQTRNPKDHPISHSMPIVNDEHGDQISQRSHARSRHCYSLVLKAGGFTANDIGISDAMHNNPRLAVEPETLEA